MAKRRWEAQNDELPKPKLDRKGLQKLLSLFAYLKPYRWKFTLSLLLLGISSITTLSFVKVTGYLIDAAKRIDTQCFFCSIDRVALTLIGILVVQSIVSYGRIILFTEVGEKMVADLRRDLYARMVILPMRFFASRRVGELAGRIASDVTQVQDTFTLTLAEFIRSILNLFICIGFILTISLKLTLLMLAVVPIIIVAAFGFGRFIRKLSRKTQDSLAQTSVIVEETLQGIQSVKAYTNEQYEIKRYQAAIAEMVGLALKGAKWRGAFASFVIFTLFGAITLILWRGFHLMAEGEITMGELTTFLLFTTFLGAAFASIGENYGQLQRTLGATERIQELLAEPTENLSYHANPAQNPLNIKGDVVFENVHFAYPGRETTPVLKGIDLSVSAGQKLALVGSSGAGKTTLTALLMRFYDPTSGRITIDGQPADAYPLAQLRERMAIVPQDVLLFGGTIRENIAYGKLTATEQQIMDAAKRANALEFINTFPEGLDTIVGERGVRLSGGQRQRIAIARAILRNPAILILDEATSALDSESERLVQAALEELMVGRTTFIIAHRLSTVREADSIAVLHNGLIVEQGTHAELIQHTDGIYKMLATLQFTANQL